VGNSFVFSLDLLASLLDVARTGHAELLRPYVPHVDRTLKWVEDNVVESVIARPGETASSVGGGYLRGWRSNHLRGEGGPIMWCTAQVWHRPNIPLTMQILCCTADDEKTRAGAVPPGPHPLPWLACRSSLRSRG
jgi:hypothetical protein